MDYVASIHLYSFASDEMNFLPAELANTTEQKQSLHITLRPPYSVFLSRTLDGFDWVKKGTQKKNTLRACQAE